MSGDYIRIAATSEIPPGTMKTVEVGSQKVLVANVGGKYYAIGAICTHAGWDLSEGSLKEKTVVCAGHGAVWNLETGHGIYRRPLPQEPAYEVRIEEGSIYVKRK